MGAFTVSRQGERKKQNQNCNRVFPDTVICRNTKELLSNYSGDNSFVREILSRQPVFQQRKGDNK